MGVAADRWRAELEAWRIPDEILAGAPESPYLLPPKLFRPERRGTRPDPASPDPASHGSPSHESPSRARALEALPAGGTVLDVGCGAGAASMALASRAGSVVGVDERSGMLAEFRAVAADAGVPALAVEGRWPDVATAVEPADVVVCHHVAYNVADLGPFVAALDEHARVRVVLELTDAHPWVPMGPFYRAVWGIDRPAGPRAADAVAVIEELGIHPHVEPSEQPGPDLATDEQVAFIRRRLCLPASRDAEVAALLAAHPLDPVRHIVTVWWER